MNGEMRREKSLRIGVHHANAVVWGPVYRTHPLVEERDVIRALLRREAFDEALVHLRGAAQHVQVLAHRGENLRSLDLDGDVRVRARELRAIPYKAMSGWSSQASVGS
jgi:hypothetical protein